MPWEGRVGSITREGGHGTSLLHKQKAFTRVLYTAFPVAVATVAAAYIFAVPASSLLQS